MHRHAAIWLDDLEARIFRIHPVESEEIAAIGPPHRIRHKCSTRPDVLHERFFQDVGESLEGMERVALAGAVVPKLAFLEYLQQNARLLAERVVSIEMPVRPTDGQLVACARTLFRSTDAPAQSELRTHKPRSAAGATLRALGLK